MIVLYDDVQKAGNLKESAKEKLYAFLSQEEPGLVEFLHRIWHHQGKAITYKELREGILNGELSQDIFNQWYQDYTRYVETELAPIWERSFLANEKLIASKRSGYKFDVYAEGTRRWIDNAGASFVTSVTNQQIRGIRAVVRRAALLHDMSVDSLARAIRPMVGLTYQQSIANLRYFENLVKNGMSEKNALDKSIKYAAKQNRYRAQMIARTELSFAYAAGERENIYQAQQQGLIGRMTKTWQSAQLVYADGKNRTCDICRALDGVKIDQDKEFNFPTKLMRPEVRMGPPAHPHCMCVLIWEEVEPAPGFNYELVN